MEKMKKRDPKRTILRIRSEFKDRYESGNPSLPSGVDQILALWEARLMAVCLLLEVEPEKIEDWIDKLVWSSDLSERALHAARKEIGIPIPLLGGLNSGFHSTDMPSPDLDSEEEP
jgi:hypothetical protein